MTTITENKKLLKKKNFYFYIFLLILVSFFFNQYYAHIGVLPVDTFSTFNGGYDVLNGRLPFRDYWTAKAPLLDLIQAFFFKVFGISWFSYSAHASVFNSLFALSTFFTLRKFNLDLKYCFIYSLLASLLMYPTYGIPFSDHHASILCMISIYCLCLAIKTNKDFYWFFLPIFLFLAFFSKQAPSGYIGVLILAISLIYFSLNFRISKIVNAFLGSLFIISIFALAIFFYNISIESLILQHFLFPLSLGESRLDWLFPLEFKRFVWRHKLIYLSLSIPIFILIKNSLKNYKYVFSRESLIIVLLIGTGLIFISHQLLTINGLFIFFLIPVFSGFSHTFSQYYFKKKNTIIFLLVLSFISTVYYHQKYISKRDTLLLRNVDLTKSIDASILDDKLKNLKWITRNYPENPKEEIQNLLDSIEIIKNDKRNKMIVTDYQFISVILSINDNSAVRIWWRHHLYPTPQEKYFDEWKEFFLKSIKKNNIEVIYTVHPLEGEDDVLKNMINKECSFKNKINNILDLQVLKDCEELKTYSNL